jgi:hypothetical protein
VNIGYRSDISGSAFGVQKGFKKIAGLLKCVEMLFNVGAGL